MTKGCQLISLFASLLMDYPLAGASAPPSLSLVFAGLLALASWITVLPPSPPVPSHLFYGCGLHGLSLGNDARDLKSEGAVDDRRRDLREGGLASGGGCTSSRGCRKLGAQRIGLLQTIGHVEFHATKSRARSLSLEAAGPRR